MSSTAASTFDHIVLNGRPGGGKSELIDFLKTTESQQRAERFHVGDLAELDDFVWLWDKFVEDDLWEELGEARRYCRKVEHGYVQFEGDSLLDMLCLKFNALVRRDFLAKPGFYDRGTLFIEFARGKGDGGYRRAYELLSKEIWQRAAIFYINVSHAESKRRNDARYQAALAHSILAHKVPDEGLERFSAHQDFEELTEGKSSGYLEFGGVRVPFVSMLNEPELSDRDALDQRYGEAFETLHRLYQSR